jgi:hypothetical protein
MLSRFCTIAIASVLAFQLTACVTESPPCDSGSCGTACSRSVAPSPGCAREPDGTCAATELQAFADSLGTTNTLCTRETPCRTIAAALATGRPYVHLKGGFVERIDITGGRHVHLIAEPGTTLRSVTPDHSVVHVADAGTLLAIYELRITGVTEPVNVIAIDRASGSPSLELHHVVIDHNTGGAMSIGDGTLTMDRTTLYMNYGGGLALFGDARFTVTNCVIAKNGLSSSSYGGLSVSVSADSQNLIAFCTLVDNLVVRGSAAGASCVGKQTLLAYNIIYANGLSNITDQAVSQTSGSCGVTHSLVYPGPLPAGPGNMGQDPLLIDTATGNYRPGPHSPAIATDADPMIVLPAAAAQDLDGKQRSCFDATLGALLP